MEHHKTTISTQVFDNRKWKIQEREIISENEQYGTVTFKIDKYIDFILDDRVKIEADSCIFDDLRRLLASNALYFLDEETLKREEKKQEVLGHKKLKNSLISDSVIGKM